MRPEPQHPSAPTNRIQQISGDVLIYGVMSYVAGQQTHEIGLRMALGAQRRDVLKQVFGEAAVMVFTGVPVGLIAAGVLTGHPFGREGDLEW